MKAKLKQLNRGLVLGFVLIIGLVIHINWEKHVFKKNIPVIEKNIEELNGEVLQSAKGDPKGFKRRATSAVQDAYTGMGDISTEVYANKAALLRTIDEWDSSEGNGTIYDISATANYIKVYKSGNGASVQYEYNVQVTYTGSPRYVDISGIHFVDGKDDGVKRVLKREGVIDCYMKKTGSGWKVVYVSSAMEYNDTEELADDGTADTEEVKGDG